jgi:hypothetical protein
MSEESLHEPEMGLSFEKVWAAIQAANGQMKETDRQMKGTDRRMQKTDREISKLGSRVGDPVEELIFPWRNCVSMRTSMGPGESSWERWPDQ